jgi:pimeloyl-ACP methyl ester carboxylesterase
VNRHPVKLTRLMLLARRAPIERTPDVPYENVSFKAGDGVGIRGWFIPAEGEGPRPAIITVHGWMWNRAGNVAGKVPVDDRDVDILAPARALHDAGFHVLMYDVRHHGESGSGRAPLTYGPIEARDFIGAVLHLRSRPEVDGQRIGSLGVSMGGSIALYAAPDCQPIKSILAVQPSTVTVFNRGFTTEEFGRFGPLMLMPPTEVMYRLALAPPPSRQAPAVPARSLDGTIVKYVQGTGDRYGSMADVKEMAAATPHTDGPVVEYPSTGRYDGYRYISERTDEIVEFFSRTL